MSSPSQRKRARCNAGALHARHLRIAEGLLLGKTVTAIAADEGITRQWVSRQANSAGVQHLISLLVSARRERIEALFDTVLNAIECSFEARRIGRLRVKGADGQLTRLPIDMGLDHRAAMAGVKAFTALLKIIRRASAPSK